MVLIRIGLNVLQQVDRIQTGWYKVEHDNRSVYYEYDVDTVIRVRILSFLFACVLPGAPGRRALL